MYKLCLTEVGGDQNLTKLFNKWIFDNLLFIITPWEGCKFVS